MSYYPNLIIQIRETLFNKKGNYLTKNKTFYVLLI